MLKTLAILAVGGMLVDAADVTTTPTTSDGTTTDKTTTDVTPADDTSDITPGSYGGWGEQVALTDAEKTTFTDWKDKVYKFLNIAADKEYAKFVPISVSKQYATGIRNYKVVVDVSSKDERQVLIVHFMIAPV